MRPSQFTRWASTPSRSRDNAGCNYQRLYPGGCGRDGIADDVDSARRRADQIDAGGDGTGDACGGSDADGDLDAVDSTRRRQRG